MKNLTKLFAAVILLTGFTFTQERPDKSKEMIITPDGKLMSRIDGSITEPNYNLNTLKNNILENDAPIGTPFSWDGSLGFYSFGGNTVNAIAVSGSDIYIGGDFTFAMGDQNSSYIVRYNQKNNTWHSLGSGLNGPVHAIAVSGNDVYVGGEFTDPTGLSNADHIARWDGSSWNALGVGLNDVVYAIAISGSDVYVGGNFTDGGGIVDADHIARWNGSAWNSMGQLDGAVYSIAVYGPEFLFVGGAFTSSSSAGRDYFATYNGSSWGSLGTTPLNGGVQAIAISGSYLYIGGAFKNAGNDQDADAIAYYDLDAFNDWQALGSGIINNDALPNGIVEAIAVSGDDVYVGGPFYNGWNSNFDNIAHWNGTDWKALSTGLTGGCSALAISGTDVLVGYEAGFERWFGAYAEGLYAGVQKPILLSNNVVVEFNTPFDSTRISLELNYSIAQTVTFNVFCYEHKILDKTILPIANHRWIIQQTGLNNNTIFGTIRIKIVDLPDSSGILDPGSGDINIFHRTTPGRGEFNNITTNPSSYNASTGEYVISYPGAGEFAIGAANTIDGDISPNEYGSHVEGKNMLTSVDKTWYMRTDDYYMYFGISNYTNENDAVNIYLDNSGTYPVNYHWDGFGTQTGMEKDGVTPNLPFGADFFTYVKPTDDEYRRTDQSGGWLDGVSDSFIKSYNDAGNIFEFAIPLSSLPVSTNQYNNPLLFFNWLGFLSNSGNILSRVPLNPNPSGIISNDLTWYYNVYVPSPPFERNSYTHIGSSIQDFGAIDCYEFTFYPQDTTIFINRTSDEWNIEDGLWVWAGNLTFQNDAAVNVGGFSTAGGTTNFSYNTSDAPLNVKYLWQWPLGGTLLMNSGHYLNFVPELISIFNSFFSNALFQNIVVTNGTKVHLRSDMKIKESLTLNGNIQTFTTFTPPETFSVILNSGATIGGTGSVEGALTQLIQITPSPNGGDSPDNLVVNFPVGTANGPSPVSIDFSSVTNGGKVTVQAFEEVHPNSVVSSESMKRYWKVTKDNDLAFTSANITFNYLPLDFNTSFFEATDEASMIVGKYDASWSFPNISSRLPGGNNDGGSITVSGITSFSDFTFAKSESALPVELTSFTASIKNSSVQLKWSTATEINNYGFEIERNTPLNPLSRGEAEGRGVWEKIGFIEGNGNSSAPKDYSFTDTKLFGGSKFIYRLKQIDNDGKFSYSDEINVEVVPDKYELSQNYPNPFNPSTRIRYQVSSIAQVTLKVYDVLGNEVATLVNEEKPAGSYEVDFSAIGGSASGRNASQLSSGIYLYKLTAGNFIQTRKMILIK